MSATISNVFGVPLFHAPFLPQALMSASSCPEARNTVATFTMVPPKAPPPPPPEPRPQKSLEELVVELENDEIRKSIQPSPPRNNPMDYLSPFLLYAPLMQLGFHGGEILGYLSGLVLNDGSNLSLNFPNSWDVLALSAIATTIDYGIVNGFIPKKLRESMAQSRWFQPFAKALDWTEQNVPIIPVGIDGVSTTIREKLNGPVPLVHDLKERMESSNWRTVSGLASALPNTWGEAANLGVFAGATALFFGLFNMFGDPAADGSLVKTAMVAMIFGPTTYNIIFRNVPNVVHKAILTSSVALAMNLSLGVVGSEHLPELIKNIGDFAVRAGLLLSVATMFPSDKYKQNHK